MRKKIHRQLMGIALVAICATLFLTLAFFYSQFVKQINEDLRSYAQILKTVEHISDYDLSQYNYQKDSVRVTLIHADGTVWYDSRVEDVSTMDNHAMREEVAMALQTGEGESIRKSATLAEYNFYYAILLASGDVLRIGQEAASPLLVIINALPALFLELLLLIVVCGVAAKVLTNHLVEPIEQMAENLNRIDGIPVYEELEPFVEMITRQHMDIMKSAKMRQEFTANVSHELKTPLTSISGYAELIQNHMANGQEERFATEIHRNASRLLTLINDIIRLSELDGTEQDGIMETVDLYELADVCVSMLQLNADKHEVQLSLIGESQKIIGNRQMLDELLYNLCDNAIRYNKKGGLVQVKIGRYDSGEVYVSVEDTGIGIPAEHQERIFERFYRVDKGRSKETGGTGLGLAIVKHIVSKHEADIKVESTVGFGTKIKVIFPK